MYDEVPVIYIYIYTHIIRYIKWLMFDGFFASPNWKKGSCSGRSCHSSLVLFA